MKALVVVGHPAPGSFCRAIADNIRERWLSAGCEVRFHDLVEEGGSLSIIATALIDTGSKMDEVIFEEFKGTGNSEIILDRKVSDKRIFPSLDVGKSGTRKEELLVDRGVLAKMWVLRRVLMPMGTTDAIEFLIDKLKQTKTNADFFDSMNT